MTDYKDLSNRLRAYSAERKGEIADLTMEAAEACGMAQTTFWERAQRYSREDCHAG